MLAVMVGHFAGGFLAALALAAAGWLALDRWRGRTRRNLAAARGALDRGDWEAALSLLRRRPPAPGGISADECELRRQLEAECLSMACDAAFAEQDFDKALESYRAAADALDLTEEESTRRVVEAMLAECRRLTLAEPAASRLGELLGRILTRQPECGEARFWLGIYHLRRGDRQAAVVELKTAYSLSHRHADAALYLGTLWLRDGQSREALRFLAEANKSAPNCPLVSWQLGAALLATGGDPLLAVRALQKAAGPEGLIRFVADPARLWADTLPPDSWLGNLARRAAAFRMAYQCPLGLDQIKSDLEAARQALGEALLLCRHYAEARALFSERARLDDSLPAVRGLGLALAALERYDEAVPHLERAHQLESPPQSRTTGALALALARATGDRLANLRRALALIAQRPPRSDAEWTRSAAAVVAAAQSLGITVPSQQVVELAAGLMSIDAADPAAAAVYGLFALHDPERVPREAAWLYVRAAEREGVRLANDERLFDCAFQNRPAMMRFFEAHEWDFAAAERLYLQRWAEQHPGSYPPAPGKQYAAHAESHLLAAARRWARQHRHDAAQDAARLALALSPASAPVHDCLAELAFRAGRISESMDWLQKWADLQPGDALPLARLGLIEHFEGHTDDALSFLARALELATRKSRPAIALAAARISLAANRPEDAAKFFDECLLFDSQHPIALAGRAALAWQSGDREQAARFVDPLSAVVAEDPRLHYVVAVSAFAARRDQLATERAAVCARQPETAAEGHHLLGISAWRRNDLALAAAEWRESLSGPSSPTQEHARALLGQLDWQAGHYADALRHWQPLAAARLKGWRLDGVIPGTAFLAGLQAFRADQPDEAAKWFRAAAKFGFDHPLLDPLLADASVAGLDDLGRAITRLEHAFDAAGPRPAIVGRLARAQRRLRRYRDAQRLLDLIERPSAALSRERGMLALANGQLVAADRYFTEALAIEPNEPAAVANTVLTRLSLGRLTEAANLLPTAIRIAPTPALRRLFTLLQPLLTASAPSPAPWSSEDDETIAYWLRHLGRLDTVEVLLAALEARRPQGALVKKIDAELLPLRIRQMLDRGNAAGVLRRYGRLAESAPPVVRNLLGIAAALRQDFAGAIRHFESALPDPDSVADARLQQNLAIVSSWRGQFEQAAEHWQRFLETYEEQTPAPTDVPDYHHKIARLVQSLMHEQRLELTPLDRR